MKILLYCGKMDGMKKLIWLILPVLLLAGCSVKEKEMDITVFGNTLPSVYTGKVKSKIPEGQGLAVMENEARAEGIFEQGVLVSGAAENVTYSSTYHDQTISGLYSGEVDGKVPSGSGSFQSEDFSFTGTWISGLPDGPGSISSEHFRISASEDIPEGSYTGEVSKGLAEGEGTFVYQDGDTETEITGQFVNNAFDGRMIKTIRYHDSLKSYPVYYKNGKPQDSAAAMIAYLEGMRSDSYCLSEQEVSFISGHSALFEGKASGNDLSKEYDSTYSFGTFKEGSEPSLILIRNAEVKSVQRYKPYAGADTVTSMIVQNDDGWYHLVFAYSVTSADRGSIVNICAMPLCRSTLTSPDGDYEAIDAAGAMIVSPGY